jgi:hypothetical protein
MIYYTLYFEPDDDVYIDTNVKLHYCFKEFNKNRILDIIANVRDHSSAIETKRSHYHDWLSVIRRAIKQIQNNGANGFTLGGNRYIEFKHVNLPTEWDD